MALLINPLEQISFCTLDLKVTFAYEIIFISKIIDIKQRMRYHITKSSVICTL